MRLWCKTGGVRLQVEEEELEQGDQLMLAEDDKDDNDGQNTMAPKIKANQKEQKRPTTRKKNRRVYW
jgi:hypothetical protein